MRVDTLLLHAYRVIHSFSIGGCLSTFQIDIQIEYKTTCIQVNKFMMRKLRSLAFSRSCSFPILRSHCFLCTFFVPSMVLTVFFLGFSFHTPPLPLSLSLHFWCNTISMRRQFRYHLKDNISLGLCLLFSLFILWALVILNVANSHNDETNRLRHIWYL